MNDLDGEANTVNRAKTVIECENCKNPFQTAIGTTVSICPNCLAQKKGSNIEKIGNELKKSIFSHKIEFELNSRDQKLAALRAQGEVFATHGGVDLMITEFVENSFDAIKKRKILDALPKALKQLHFSLDLEKIMIDKYTLPVTKFNEKYPEFEINNENISKLQKQIFNVIKSENQPKENIVVELDDKTQEVKIIDSGTGIEQPIHICQNPLISLKTGEDYSTGKYGRGSQVFREFCNLMEFFSFRNTISDGEKEILKNPTSTDENNARSIRVEFPADYPGGIYHLDHSHQFKKLSNSDDIGTVVILNNWKQNYYEELSKNISKLERRLVHHFGFAIADRYNIGLKLIHKNKEIEISAKDYANDSKIQDLFELPSIPLKTESGKLLGEVEFFIYKTKKSYNDIHKKPFLVVNGRPLGDTSISEIPRLSQHKEIWQSHTITGYVVCNAVQPNEMRIGLADNDAVIPFIHAMTAASIDLKRLNTIWKNELSAAIDKSIMNDVIDAVTNFLSKKGMKFNFTNPPKKGPQEDPKKIGKTFDEDKVSFPGNDKKGDVLDAHGDPTNVGYRSSKPKKPTDVDWDDPIIVPHGGKKKEGSKVVTVRVKRSLVSKGGKRKRRSHSGPDLDFSADEDCGDELSYFEPSPPTVMVQSEHPVWKKLTKKAKNQTNIEKIEKDKKNYLMERYLWEIMHNDAVQKDDGLKSDDRTNMFWTYYHDLIDTK